MLVGFITIFFHLDNVCSDAFSKCKKQKTENKSTVCSSNRHSVFFSFVWTMTTIYVDGLNTRKYVWRTVFYGNIRWRTYTTCWESDGLFFLYVYFPLSKWLLFDREKEQKKKCSVSEVVLCMSRWYSNGYWWGWNAISIDKMRSNHECIVDLLLSFRCAICIVHMFRRVCWHVKHIRLLAMKCGNVKRLQ